MNESSNRLRQAVDFLEHNGYAKNDGEIARKIGVLDTSLSNSLSGYRPPSIDLMLALCDHYPINFWWLRSGEGEMLHFKTESAIALLRKIAECEKTNAELREEIAGLKKRIAKRDKK